MTKVKRNTDSSHSSYSSMTTAPVARGAADFPWLPVRQPAFGRRLRELRGQRRLSQRDVAGDLVSASYVSLLEAGARVPTLDVAVHVARALDVTLEDLLGQDVRAREQLSDGATLLMDVLARASVEAGDLSRARAQLQQLFIEETRLEGRLRAGLDLQDVLAAAGDQQERYALLEELSSLARDAQLPDLLVKIHTDQAAAARELGRLPKARELISDAHDRVQATLLKGTSEHVRVLGVYVSVLADSGDLSEVPSLITLMLQLAEELDIPAVIGRAYWVASVACGRMGDDAAARRHLERARLLLASPTIAMCDWLTFSISAASMLLDADDGAALAAPYIDCARAALSLMDMPAEHVRLLIVSARYELALGRFEQAVRYCEEADQREPGLSAFDYARAQLTWGRALRGLGDLPASVSCLRTAAQICEQVGALHLALQAWRELDALQRGVLDGHAKSASAGGVQGGA